ncbi:hypothetical protein [Pararhizobium mangrovi]|uniref:Uncharacterized protein n=1 Tax=Pararhizobium mangrovi TaxID=2590452 RepID=A0A506U3D0_9HYPH|nr:hypothetical protein [Pararhizobium mangrovi]TPW28340.1 hypothetical protein FJU11_09285 [Pararhizobium mangrovi]
MMTSNRTTLILLASTLAAGICAALVALAIATGPAIGRDRSVVDRADTPACRHATWPYIPPQCIRGAKAGAKKITYARPLAAARDL